VKAVNTFDTLSSTLERILEGTIRQEVVAEAATAPNLEQALLHLREQMRSHAWTIGPESFDSGRAVEKLDRKTRQIGFHVLHDWDGIADRVNEDTIPVDVLHYLADRRGEEPADPLRLALLLDYHFLHLLALLSVRIWDDGDADANLDRVETLLRHLQGPYGSGQLFTSDAETLLLLATSHYEMYERGYSVLLEQVRTLNEAHRTRIALGHAVSMGCHLRFGFEATYGRDTINMRDDNVADYPWLLFALATLMNAFARLGEAGQPAASRESLIEALANGLSGDARAFVGKPPTSLAAVEPERAAFRDLFDRFKEELLDEFERYRPTPQRYSPLNFFFNFSHNVLKGTIIDALLRQEPWRVSFNDLLTSRPSDAAGDAEKQLLARTLMDYARANPQTIRGRLMPVIVYDPGAGRQAFSVALRKLREE
jgi:hypothetical protein